jgi:hypothetical protein
MSLLRAAGVLGFLRLKNRTNPYAVGTVEPARPTHHKSALGARRSAIVTNRKRPSRPSPTRCVLTPHYPGAKHATATCGSETTKLYLRVQRTLANRERTAAAERFVKHGPGRLEREGPAVRVSDAVAKAKRAARAKVRQHTTGQHTTGDVLPEAAE